MVERFSSLAERIQHAFVWALVVIVTVLGIIYGYWYLGDKTPPIRDPAMRIVDYTPGENHMWVDFSFIKATERHCSGIRYMAISEPGAEPPTRKSISLDPVPLPPADFSGIETPLGKEGHRIRLVILPATLPVPFYFNAEWAFSCNRTQHDDRVITVKAKPLLVDGPVHADQ